MILRIIKEMVSKAIINRSKVLLLKRAEKCLSEKAPWTWDLPGGHRNSEESLRGAARREVMEETGLEVGEFSFVGKDSNIGKLTYFYKVGLKSERIELSEEHIEYKWVSKADLSKYREGLGDMYYKMVLGAL